MVEGEKVTRYGWTVTVRRFGGGSGSAGVNFLTNRHTRIPSDWQGTLHQNASGGYFQGGDATSGFWILSVPDGQEAVLQGYWPWKNKDGLLACVRCDQQPPHVSPCGSGTHLPRRLVAALKRVSTLPGQPDEPNQEPNSDLVVPSTRRRSSGSAQPATAATEMSTKLMEEHVNVLGVLIEPLFKEAYQHRGVRRVAPDPEGMRFLCTEENGTHACWQEAVDLNRALDLHDLVPVNRAPRLQRVLDLSSDKNGIFFDAAVQVLEKLMDSNEVPTEQRAVLLQRRSGPALEYLFAVIEAVLDANGAIPQETRLKTASDASEHLGQR